MSCLVATKQGKPQIGVSSPPNGRLACRKPRHKVRIRLIALPKGGDLDEFNLQCFRVGQEYELPVRLASVLLIGGYAELAPTLVRDRSADSSKLREPEF